MNVTLFRLFTDFVESSLCKVPVFCSGSIDLGLPYLGIKTGFFYVEDISYLIDWYVDETLLIIKILYYD